MALERLDLNLLRVFQAIDAERHVTRAAARLGVTQSAASNALARLRLEFQDDLFQRTPAGMEPTALARELAGPVRAALDAVRAAVELNRPFEPATARDEFVVGVSDYAEFVLAPPLVAALRDGHPGSGSYSGTPIGRGRWHCSTRIAPTWRSASSPSPRRG